MQGLWRGRSSKGLVHPDGLDIIAEASTLLVLRFGGFCLSTLAFGLCNEFRTYLEMQKGAQLSTLTI